MCSITTIHLLTVFEFPEQGTFYFIFLASDDLVDYLNQISDVLRLLMLPFENKLKAVI